MDKIRISKKPRRKAEEFKISPFIWTTKVVTNSVQINALKSESLDLMILFNEKLIIENLTKAGRLFEANANVL